MDLFETQKQKTICKESICEECGYAEFDSPDYEYSGDGEYVDDCAYPSHNSEFAENAIEQMLDCETQGERRYCPFFIPRFPREFELLRCPSCNSPGWENVHYSIDDNTMTEKLKCTHCGEVRTESIERVAYSCCP